MLTLNTLRRKFADPLWYWYLGGMLFLLLTNRITVEIPQLTKQAVNQLRGVDAQSIKTLALTIILLGILQVVVRGLSRILIFWPGRVLEASAKTWLFKRLMHIPTIFLEKHGLGDLISRLSNDMSYIRVFFLFGLLQVLNLVFIIFFTLHEMIKAHPRLTWICLIPISTMLIITRFIMPRMQKYSKENQEAIGRLTNKVTEAFVNVHVIQTNSSENAFLERAKIENQTVFQTNMKNIILRTVFFPLMTCLTGIAQLIVLFYGGHEVMQGNISVGDIIAFNIYLTYLAFPLTSIGILISIYQRSQTAISRLSEIYEAEPEKTIPTKKTLTESPLLEVKNLSWSWPTTQNDNNSTFGIKNISFSINEGEQIGIFGQIASGKSTLFKLITRLIEPPKDTIFFKGQDIITIPHKVLRKNLGLALQSAQLFSDTVINNITFGISPTPDEAQIYQAAKQAEVFNDIETLSHKWKTQIGEKGVRLSGGQKQRLALARLFIRQPNILLLDDVLSAVDHETEVKLIKNISDSPSSLLIASHRVSVFKNCKTVFVLENGAIVDQGPWRKIESKWIKQT